MRRNDLDICADILRVAKRGAKKTQIVYQANLNFKIVKKYLKRLIENGLLDSFEKERLFRTTSKGVDFHVQYSELVAPINSMSGEWEGMFWIYVCVLVVSTLVIGWRLKLKKY